MQKSHFNDKRDIDCYEAGTPYRRAFFGILILILAPITLPVAIAEFSAGRKNIVFDSLIGIIFGVSALTVSIGPLISPKLKKLLFKESCYEAKLGDPCYTQLWIYLVMGILFLFFTIFGLWWET